MDGWPWQSSKLVNFAGESAVPEGCVSHSPSALPALCIVRSRWSELHRQAWLRPNRPHSRNSSRLSLSSKKGAQKCHIQCKLLILLYQFQHVGHFQGQWRSELLDSSLSSIHAFTNFHLFSRSVEIASHPGQLSHQLSRGRPSQPAFAEENDGNVAEEEHLPATTNTSCYNVRHTAASHPHRASFPTLNEQPI